MYNHKETVAFLQSIIGQEIKVYTLDGEHSEYFIGHLLEVNPDHIVVDCKIIHSTKKKAFFFFNKKVYIDRILTTKDWKQIYKVIAVSEEASADIRNTLGPIKNLLALLQSDQKDKPVVQEMIRREIENAEAAVEYLSNLNTL
ncbi:MAG: hypothetical protein WCO66_02200 [Candidatus Absconditabacteria bacterium]